MIIQDFIPVTFKKYIKLVLKRKKYPGRKINSGDIGSDVKLGIKCGIYENVIIGNKVSIGDYSYINTGSTVSSGIIGKFTSIGSNCQIGGFEHPVDQIATSPFIYQRRRSILEIQEDLWNEVKKPTIIGNDVWIGSNSVVKQGVVVGDGVVIASGAVVTKDVEPYTIVGGVPAKAIRKRFSEEKISYLMNLKWWDMSIEELRNNKALFKSKGELQK